MENAYNCGGAEGEGGTGGREREGVVKGEIRGRITERSSVGEEEGGGGSGLGEREKG